MADIELVVKIDEQTYNNFARNEYSRADVIAIHNIIANGTPLPKGHGKIGDLTKLYNEIDARNKGKDKGKYTGILALVGFADTIIEADREE